MEPRMSDINLRLSQRVKLDFFQIKNAVSNKWGKKASNVDTVVELIQAYKDRKQLIEDLRVSETKLRKKDDEIFQLLKESINRPININVGALAQTNTVQQWEQPKPTRKIVGAKQADTELLAEFKKICIPENCVNGFPVPSKVKWDDECWKTPKVWKGKDVEVVDDE